MSIYRWVRHEGAELKDVGVNPDGSLHNPNGYDPELVRAAVAAADQYCHERSSRAARRAAATRAERKAKRVYEATRRIASGEMVGPRTHCYCCGRSLDDGASIRRGIGAECWQQVLQAAAT